MTVIIASFVLSFSALRTFYLQYGLRTGISL